MGWWQVVRPFAPWVAVILAFILAWNCGAGRAKDKMRGKVADAEAATRLVEAERDILREALDSWAADLEASNQRVAAKAEAFDLWVEAFEVEADRTRIALASSYAIRVEEARAETSELRTRISEMEPGEACCEALGEVAHALDP